jgi:hypothetical protein
MMIDPESHLLLHRLLEPERDRQRDHVATARAARVQDAVSNTSRLRQRLLRRTPPRKGTDDIRLPHRHDALSASRATP